MTLSTRIDGEVTPVAGPLDFKVVRVFEGVLEGTSPEKTAVFMRQVAELKRAASAASLAVSLGFDRIAILEKALARSTSAPGTLDTELEALKQRLYDLDEALEGNDRCALSASRGFRRCPADSGWPP